MNSHNKFLICLHIQKTAGMSFQRMMRRRYGPSLLKRLASRLSEGNNNLKDAMGNVCFEDGFFMGHFCYGAHRYLPDPFTYITFLREPISRLLSLYSYSKANPTAYYHKQARECSAESFFFESGLLELNDGMTRFISGDEKDLFINRTPFGRTDGGLLDRAKDNLKKDFSFVGLVERFDESVLILQKEFGWRNAYYLRRNSPNRTGNVEIGIDLAERLIEQNQLDIMLYEHVKTEFERRVAELGESFKIQTKRFKLENARRTRLMLPFYDLYDRLKATASGNPDRPK